MLTAISVARQCHMVPGKDEVILVNAVPPEGDRRAEIQWERAEGTDGNESEAEMTMDNLAAVQASVGEVSFKVFD